MLPPDHRCQRRRDIPWYPCWQVQGRVLLEYLLLQSGQVGTRLDSQLLTQGL